jgi:hypothetical protein
MWNGFVGLLIGSVIGAIVAALVFGHSGYAKGYSEGHYIGSLAPNFSTTLCWEMATSVAIDHISSATAAKARADCVQP